MYERTKKPNNRTNEVTARQTKNGPMAQTNARKPGHPQMAEIHLFLFKTKEKILSQFGLEQRRAFLSGLK